MGEIKKVDKEEIQLFIKKNVDVTKFRGIYTPMEAYKHDSNYLAEIKKDRGVKVPLAILKFWLIEFNDFLNVKRKMTESQIDQTADMLMMEFYYFKVADISLVFKRMKSGHYGPFYEAIDGMKVMDCFHKYAQERIQTIALQNDMESYESSRHEYNPKTDISLKRIK